MNSGAPPFGPRARLTLFFLLSLTLHAAILFGLGFTRQAEPTRQAPPIIEITLAQPAQEAPPQDFDFLAQADQTGGGKGKSQPKSPIPPDPPPTSLPKPPPEPMPVAKSENTPAKSASASATTAHLDMADILDASHRVAASREFSGALESVSAHYPSERRIDARTYSYAAAEYMRQWVEKVERIGNLNYPRAARERDISGRLILEVTLRPDGSVYAINLLVPSPFDVLNEAAKRIVKLAEPYAKIPGTVLQGRDLLVITRSWEFDETSHFYPR